MFKIALDSNSGSKAQMNYQESLSALTAMEMVEVTSRKNAKESCVYSKAATKAATTQGKALCIAKRKGAVAEYDAIKYLNQFEAVGSKTLLPNVGKRTRTNLYNVDNWKTCIGFVSGYLNANEVANMRMVEGSMGEYVPNFTGEYRTVKVPRVEWTAEQLANMENFKAPEFTVDADMMKAMEGAYAHKVSHSGNKFEMNVDGGKNVNWSETVTGPTLVMEGSKVFETVEVTTPKVEVSKVFETVEVISPLVEVSEVFETEEIEIETPSMEVEITEEEVEVEVTAEDDSE